MLELAISFSTMVDGFSDKRADSWYSNMYMYRPFLTGIAYLFQSLLIIAALHIIKNVSQTE